MAAPQTLPADFTGFDDDSTEYRVPSTGKRQQQKQAPDTLPADFNGWDDSQEHTGGTPVPQVQNQEQTQQPIQPQKRVRAQGAPKPLSAIEQQVAARRPLNPALAGGDSSANTMATLQGVDAAHPVVAPPVANQGMIAEPARKLPPQYATGRTALSVAAPEEAAPTDMLRNTAPAYAIEQAMPAMAQALNIHPSNTRNNPEYESNKANLVNFHEALSPNPTGGEALARGVLRGGSALTSAPNLIMAGIGLPGGIVGKLILAGFTVQGLKGMYENSKEYRAAVERGDYDGALQVLGEGAVNAVMVYGGARGMMHGEGGLPAVPKPEVIPPERPVAPAVEVPQAPRTIVGDLTEGTEGPRINPAQLPVSKPPLQLPERTQFRSDEPGAGDVKSPVGPPTAAVEAEQRAAGMPVVGEPKTMESTRAGTPAPHEQLQTLPVVEPPQGATENKALGASGDRAIGPSSKGNSQLGKVAAPGETKPGVSDTKQITGETLVPQDETAGPGPGMVRLYRGEQTPGTGTGVADWIKEDDKYKAQALAEGRWFTNDLAEARKYAEEAGAAGRVTYLDLPQREADQMRAVNDPEANKFVHHTKRDVPNDEYYVTREMADKALPHTETPPTEEADPSLKTAQDDKALQGKGTRLYGGAAIADPEVVKELFPSVVERMGKFADGELGAGDLMKGITRQVRGEFDRKKEQLYHKLKGKEKEFNRRPMEEVLGVIHAIETGLWKSPDYEMSDSDRAFARTYRDIMDSARKDVQDLGRGALESYIENYYKHMWEDPDKVSDVFKRIMTGRAPLRGTQSWLEQRTIPTVQDGLDLGFKLKEPNPVRVLMAGYVDVQKFVMAYKILEMGKETKEPGGAPLFKFFPYGEKVDRAVWSKLNDPMFEILQKMEVQQVQPHTGGTPVPQSANPRTEQVTVKRGDYYGLKDAANILNNMLSPGLQGKAPYDMIRYASNIMNQAQLSWSGFHIGFMTMNAAANDLSLAMQKVSRGDVKGAINPLARGLTLGPISAANDWRNGSLVMKAYLDPDAWQDLMRDSSPNMTLQKALGSTMHGRVAEALSVAGGRIRQDPFYRNASMKALVNALQGVDPAKVGTYGKADALGVLRHVVPAVMEGFMWPIMDQFVPRLKVGAFYNLAADILERSDKEGWTPEKRRESLQQAWNTVDGRMGQVVYDNVFVHRVLKDAVMLGLRAPGWSLGSLYLAGKGVQETGQQAARMFTGKRPEVTANMAYPFGIATTVAILGALFGYMATGKKPEKIKDLVAPKTGRKTPRGDDERIWFNTYVKDALAYSRAPLDVFGHKVHPLVSSAIDVINNKDFYGEQIRDPESSVWEQAWDEAKFGAKLFVPFSIKGYQQMAKTDAPTWQKVGSQFAYTPAPGYMVRSPAEEKAREFNADKSQQGPRSKDEVEQQQRRMDAVGQLRTGSIEPRDVWDQVQAGTLTAKDAHAIMKMANTDAFAHDFAMLDLKQALVVWNLADEGEREKLRPLLGRKGKTLGKYLPEERQVLRDKLDGAMEVRPKVGPPDQKL